MNIFFHHQRRGLCTKIVPAAGYTGSIDIDYKYLQYTFFQTDMSFTLVLFVSINNKYPTKQ